MSNLKNLLSERACVGTFVKLADPYVVDIVAESGADFLVCDFEHSQQTYADVSAAIAAGRAVGLPVSVRIPDHQGGTINRLLEAGAAAIQLSDVRHRQEADALYRSMMYPPDGDRSLSLAQPAAVRSRLTPQEFIASQNRAVCVIGQIESDLDEVALDGCVSSLDVAFIGLFDLSVRLGVTGSFTSQRVRAAVEKVERAAINAGVFVGSFARDPAEAQKAVDRGHRYVVISSDMAVLQTAMREQFRPFTDLRAARHA